MIMDKFDILKSKKLFLLDMDGTIYLGDRLFDGAKDFLECIKRNGGRYAFMTNNSSKSALAYIEKLGKMGIEATKDDFVTSVNATVDYLWENHKKDVIYVMGTRSFIAELVENGLNIVTDPLDNVSCLVCGFDTELTYKKLEDACALLRRGIKFIATNPDWVCPTADGYIPDCGSMCEMLFRATGKKPLVIGKPMPNMALSALKRYGYKKKDALIIGDRLYTDIACGVNSGIDTAFVLSGEGTIKDIEEMNIQPTFIFQHIKDILEIL